MALFWLLWIGLSGVALAQGALELEVLQRTNQARTEHGLRPLQWDALAHKAALAHAQDMLRRNFFAHQNPDGQGAADRLRAIGVLEVMVGENLASFDGYPDAEIPRRALVGWMNSPGHRANLLKPEFTHLGVGLLREGRRVMVVQNFLGRPFDPQLRQTPAQAERTVLVLSGTAPGTVGVFVGNHLYARLNPPIHTRLELPPRSEVSYALFDGQTWWATRNGERGLRLETALEQTQVPGRQISFSLPAGSYTLALGAQPRFWQNISGPVRLELTLPGTLEALWLGIRQGNSVNYSHRIPLKP
ncbi:MAG: CAP domain-containing protein [Meiothermus sp.]|uniref:CAP domain-containing protein n=1 Tax=Meiothermus sp. TaxID=1955249 RepID=UPI0025F2DCD0|nr:CAP domain-containing protein [Meiothermus sp.]MCS7068094.1 CAP domain-containing protein [Meiothermus sp.]MDW8425727.1 CAP domain-containing protein [Meiothermus sp.]